MQNIIWLRERLNIVHIYCHHSNNTKWIETHSTYALRQWIQYIIFVSFIYSCHHLEYSLVLASEVTTSESGSKM